MISVSPQTNIIIKRKPNAPESSTRSNPITQQRDSSFETMAKLKKLYQKLEIQINNIVLRRPNQKQEIQVTKETLNEIINFEKQFIANKKEPPEKNIPTSSTDVNLRRDFLLQALNSSLENLTPNWLKSIVVPLYSRLDPNNPEQSIEAVIELGNQSQEKVIYFLKY
jgi:poly-beta-hydroxyalkanoate depolymerase